MSAAGSARGSGLRRIGAMMARHFYLIRRSWPRLLSFAYYPVMQLLVWAFVTKYLAAQSGSQSVLQAAPGILLTGVLLWDVLVRGELGLFLSFLEEMYSRNLGNLFVSPLRLHEFVIAQMLLSIIRVVIGSGMALLVAVVFFDLTIVKQVAVLAGCLGCLLVFGWSIGLIANGLVLRFGLGAEEIGWAVVFLIGPLSGAYYPVAVLPQWLQWVALTMPTAWTFEAMRAALIDGQARWDLLAWSLAIAVAYLGFGAIVFRQLVEAGRRRGLLLQMGE
ncbi:ABC transporter permease [Casimicrobium huifangae]|uniref:ABC transporter permease n=1 Tax=Casimicrobium huifangae TaxID=2591109 RepID=UPI00378411F3